MLYSRTPSLRRDHAVIPLSTGEKAILHNVMKFLSYSYNVIDYYVSNVGLKDHWTREMKILQVLTSYFFTSVMQLDFGLASIT